MNMDDPDLITHLDCQNMLSFINDLPNQLENAYQLGMSLPLSISTPIHQVVLAGMGGSAMAADLLRAYAQPVCPVPVVVHRDYGLPGWANGAHTLVVAISHSGETEETVSALQVAVERGCSALTISTGGALMQLAQKNQIAYWKYDYAGTPRSAIGIHFGLSAAILVRLSLLPDMHAEMADAANLMRSLQAAFQPAVPVAKNRAKRDAGQLMGRWVVLLGADHLAPVARRWKNQINELAKSWAQAEVLPEADHNSLVGLLNPEEALTHTLALFLTSSGNHSRNQVRLDLTRQVFLQQGVGTDYYMARGDSRLSQMWSAVHYGDYLAYYLALAYGIDPTPVDIIEGFKAALQEV